MGIATSDGEYFETELDYVASVSSPEASTKPLPQPVVPAPLNKPLTFEDYYMDSVVDPEIAKQNEFRSLLNRFKERYDETKKAGQFDHMKELERHIMDIYDEITKGREPIKFPDPGLERGA
jgi:hypothetical protein